MSKLTDDELRQRQEAARKHGAYAFLTNGEQALDENNRSYLAELRDDVKTREGVLELMKENAAKSKLTADMVLSYIAEEVKAGIPLEEVSVLRALPAFFNTAQRALKDLLENLPPEPRENAEFEKIQKVIDSDTAS
jgi:hypothetical protein